MIARRLLEVGVLVSLPRFVEPGSHFLRTVILSRMLAPRDFGLAIAITVVISFADLVSDFGLDRFLISRASDDDREALAAAHGLQVMRGLVIAALIWFGAPWIGRLFGASAHAADFQWCAAILALRAFVHLDVRQVQRALRFAPEATASLSARLAALAAVYPAVLAFGDFRAMIASLMVDAVVYVIASHLLARSRFRVVTRDRQTWRDAIAYALPLTINGIGLAANSQLDRAFVGHWFGVETLALYAVTLNLAVVPAVVLAGILSLLSVSLIAREHGAAARAEAYVAVAWVHATIGAAYALFVATTLDVLVPFVFGSGYTVSPSMTTLIALIAWFRVSRGAPNALMLADARTGRLMTANLLSSVGLVVAVGVLPFVPRPETMLACVLFGDAVSLGYFLFSGSTRTSQRAAAYHICRSLALVVGATIAVRLVLPAGLPLRALLVCAAMLLFGADALFGFRRNFRHNRFLAAFAEFR